MQDRLIDFIVHLQSSTAGVGMLVWRGKASILTHLKAIQTYFAWDKCSYIFCFLRERYTSF